MRPTVLEAKDLPVSTNDGCISDFDSAEVINYTYGDKAATRTIALAGGSHAEHWITALDLLGRLHHFKVVTYLKMGCVDHRKSRWSWVTTGRTRSVANGTTG